jgi:hypothetical protein
MRSEVGSPLAKMTANAPALLLARLSSPLKLRMSESETCARTLDQLSGKMCGLKGEGQVGSPQMGPGDSGSKATGLDSSFFLTRTFILIRIIIAIY